MRAFVAATRSVVNCMGICRRKILFKTEEKALKYIQINQKEMLEKIGCAPVRAYYCVYCGGWHVTSMAEYDEEKKSRHVRLAMVMQYQYLLKANMRRRRRTG